MNMHILLLALATPALASIKSTSRAVALRTTSGAATGFGASACPCVGFDKVDGTTIVTIAKDSNMEYPLELGGTCQAWDDDRHPSCKKGEEPGKGKGWCAQSWCYVDPCNCNIPVPPKVSAYMPAATYQAKPVYYSYATCGGKDTWTSENHKEACVNQKNFADCTKNDKCGWNGKVCMGKEVLGQCSQKLHGFTWGMGNCRCIGVDGRDGVLNAVIAKDKKAPYPAETGGTCHSWDDQTHPDCKKPDAPKWCRQQWCYVDPCSCSLNTPPVVAGYVPDGLYQGRPIYFSYETCGSVDTYTADFHKEACKNQKTKSDCGKLDKCGWTGEKCLGKDLVEVCTRKDSGHYGSDKSGSWASSASLVALFIISQAF